MFIEFSKGIVYYIKNKKNKKLIYHNCNIKSDYSYGPIILLNNLKIIGINKEDKKNRKKKKGLYFKEIIENINEDNKIYVKNVINCILNIDLKENEKIIFNQNEKNKDEICDNVNVFLENKRINIKNEKNKWKIDYKFEKEGKYNLKILFKNNIKDLKGLFENCKILYSLDLSNFDTSKVNDMG